MERKVLSAAQRAPNGLFEELGESGVVDTLDHEAGPVDAHGIFPGFAGSEEEGEEVRFRYSFGYF